jgi:hypothetical protein
MKKIAILLSTFVLFCQFSFAQWSLGGNTNTDSVNQYLGTSDLRPIMFRTSGTAKMKIVSNGNVLIGGTTDNGFKLNVNGTFRTQGNVTVTGNLILGSGGTISSTTTTGLQLSNNGQGNTQLNFTNIVPAGNLGLRVGSGSNAAASTMFEVISTTKGSIPAPLMTSAQRTAIASPANGLLVYQTDGTAGFYVNQTGTWRKLLTTADPTGGSTIYTANGSLTSNRFIDLNTSTLSIGKTSTTTSNLHLFNNGNVWVGNATTPSDNGTRLQVTGNTSLTDGELQFRTAAFANNTRIYRDRDLSSEGIIFRTAGSTGGYASKFQFLTGHNGTDHGHNILFMTGGTSAWNYSAVYGGTGVAGTRHDANARVSILTGETSATAISVYNPANSGGSASYLRFSSVLYGDGSPSSGGYIKYQGIASTYGGDIVFGINNGSSTLNETDVLTVHRSGNLLIGTAANNGNKLQVNGTIHTTGFTLPTGAGAGKVLTSDANGVASWQNAGTGANTIYNSNGTLTSNRLVDLGTATLSFKKDANTNFHVFNNGNVWIGNGTPVDNGFGLNVNYNAGFKNNITLNEGNTINSFSPSIIFRAIGQDLATVQSGSIQLSGYGPAGGEFLQLNAGGIRLNTGDAGVNIAGANPLLYSVSPAGLRIAVNSISNGIVLSNGYAQTSGYLFRLLHSTTSVMTVPAATNNIIINGTSDDGVNKLQVNGSISTTGFKMNTGAGAGRVLTSDANGVASWATAQTGIGGSSVENGISFNTTTQKIELGGTLLKSTSIDQNTFNLIFSGTGNIGIGTATPSEKLAVNGNIITKKIRVTQTGWADYVFDKDYELPTLQEIEEYIKKYKHLPEVPTTQEVQEKGVDVGDTQVILLKKVEELTLYLIQQNKQIEQLKKELTELKKKKKN